MKDRWIQLKDGAKERQKERFDRWLSAENIPFASPEAKEQYKGITGMFIDALQMEKEPERIPVSPSAGSYPIEYSGISWYEAMYDYDKLAYAWEKYHADFMPDAYHSPKTIVPGKALDILDFSLYRWAGGDLRNDQEYQFVEREYMTADEYLDLIDDPTGFFLRKFFPRIFGKLNALKKIPSLPPIHELPLVPPGLVPFGAPDMKETFALLCEASDEVNKWLSTMNKIGEKVMGMGMPAFSAGFTKAPFDVIGDSLRGTKGVLMDMFRHPDELIEACERITPFMVNYGIAACEAAGHIMPFIPLHKGSDTFMSEEQFATFYWPTLRKLIIGLADAGIVPQLFVEGSYNRRLDIVDDLPGGIVLWWFDATDMAAAKRTVGRSNCIAGNVPLDILCAGTTDDVKECCKELIEKAGGDGGFIMTSGAGVQGSKAENIKTMIDYTKENGKYI